LHSELRNALTELNALSNSNTRRLDTTYYSVLEKLSALQNTICSLKELADLARSLDSEFKAEAEIVETEFTSQLDAFENFDSQEEMIEDLQKRVEVGRKKIKGLGERVEQVRERVDGWERGEKEWQDKTRKRMRVMWIVGTSIVGVIAAIWTFHTPGSGTGLGVERNGTALNTTGLLGKIPDEDSGVLGKMKDVVGMNRSWGLKGEQGELLEELRSRNVKEKVEDSRLKLFDEL
jgi:hypothetical protein